MTATLLQFDFPFKGPWGLELAQALEGLARDIADEDGLVWKIWTENEAEARAGGVYLFRDEEQARRYQAKHSERLKLFGIDGIVARSFAVCLPLSTMTRGPVDM